MSEKYIEMKERLAKDVLPNVLATIQPHLDNISKKQEEIVRGLKASKVEDQGNPSGSRRHWTAEEYLSSAETCVDCKREVEKIGKHYMKKFLDASKDVETYDLICTGCGIPLKEEEPKCPLCGSDEAKRR